jgi:hypothetical protein
MSPRHRSLTLAKIVSSDVDPQPAVFLLQWDDDLVPRDSGLALFDAFASRQKTLHANPGRHMGVPALELESSQHFFTRHLLEHGASTMAR